MIVKVLCHFPAGELRFATENLQDPAAGNWENLIIDISSLSMSIGDDKSFEVSSMEITLSDRDRTFREMMSGSDRYIAGKKVEIFTVSNQLIYTGTVEKWKFTESAFTLIISDKLSGLERVVSDSYPAIYGYVYADEGAVKCGKISTGTYLLAAHHCKEVTSVYNENGSTVSESFTLENNIDGNAFIHWSPLEGEEPDVIYANVKGKMDESSNLIEDPVEAVKDIFLSVDWISLDESSLIESQSIMQERGYKIALALTKDTNVSEFLSDFCFSFDCDFYLTVEGKICISIMDLWNLTPISSLQGSEIIDMKIEESPDQIRNKVKYMYRYNFGKEYFERLPFHSDTLSITNWGEFYNTNEALDLRYVSDESTAFDVVQRYVFQKKNPPRRAFITIPIDEKKVLVLSKIVSVTHPVQIESGTRRYKAERLSIDFLNDLVEIEGIDTVGLTGEIFILGDDSISDNWENASEGERQFAYLCDENGFLPGGDLGKILY